MIAWLRFGRKQETVPASPFSIVHLFLHHAGGGGQHRLTAGHDLQAQRSLAKNSPTRANGTVDDSRRYRDNVAEYYRKLGGTNDEK